MSRSPSTKKNIRRQNKSYSPAAFLDELESRVLLSGTAIPLFQLKTTNVVLPSASTGAGGYSPAQIRAAYGLSSVAGDGTGQTIAIVDAYNDPNIQADLKAFDAYYGLTNTTLTVLNQTGGTTLPSTDPSGRGDSWALETSLDVEWAHAIAPGAKILLVEANSASDSDLLKAVDTARNYSGVSVVSLSWGESEWSGETSEDSHFTTPSGHIGVTFFVSSGDDGAYDSGSSSVKTVDYPSASPNVISVGGTSVSISSNGTYLSETAWGSGTSSVANGGSGGGISVYEAQPAWQKSVVTQSTTKRTLPDVSMVADPNTGVAIYDSYDMPGSPWTVIGGTSLAAPIWAGIMSIVDQARASAGCATLTSAQTLNLLYSAPSTDFHDITTGSNGYSATTGYDLVTGRGTPITNLLVPYLATGSTVVTPTPTIGSFTSSSTTVPAGTTITLTASNVIESSGTNTISSVSFYLESNSTSGLQTSGDTLIGAGTKSGSNYSISTSTTGLAPGTYTYYAVATDSAGKTTTSTLTLTVVTPIITSFTVSPSAVTPGTAVTLTASNVTETNGTIANVSFYLESNSTTGLQTATDTLLGTGTKSGSNYTFSVSTAALAPGKYTYYAIATDALGNTSTVATATLTVSTVVTTTLSNDNFASATVLSGTAVIVTGTNVGATKQTGEPTIAGQTGGKSVWYSWTAAASGTVTLNTHGSSFDTLLGVYTGTSVTSLKTIASNDDDRNGRTLTSAVTFNAIAGTTYYFAVDGYHGASGNIVLNLNQVTAATHATATTTTSTSSISLIIESLLHLLHR